MKLTELEPAFLGCGGEGISDHNGNPVPHRPGIGLHFNCPCGCGDKIYVPFKNPLDGGLPPYKHEHSWQREGESFETLSLTPSILRKSGCGWHGYITKGEIITV